MPIHPPETKNRSIYNAKSALIQRYLTISELQKINPNQKAKSPISRARRARDAPEWHTGGCAQVRAREQRCTCALQRARHSRSRGFDPRGFGKLSATKREKTETEREAECAIAEMRASGNCFARARLAFSADARNSARAMRKRAGRVAGNVGNTR